MLGIPDNIQGIPENFLHLHVLIPFVQNLTSTLSIWSEFSDKTCFVYMTPNCQIWKPLPMSTTKFCGMYLKNGIKLTKQLLHILKKEYTCQKN